MEHGLTCSVLSKIAVSCRRKVPIIMIIIIIEENVWKTVLYG